MDAIRRVLIAIVAALMASTAVILGIYMIQRAILGDVTPFVILGISILILFRLSFAFRRIFRGFSGLSGYRRNLPKDR